MKNRDPSKEDIEKTIVEFNGSDDDEDMANTNLPQTFSKIKVDLTKEDLKRIRQQYKGCPHNQTPGQEQWL